jgi:hypothetical protein
MEQIEGYDTFLPSMHHSNGMHLGAKPSLKSSWEVAESREG